MDDNHDDLDFISDDDAEEYLFNAIMKKQKKATVKAAVAVAKSKSSKSVQPPGKSVKYNKDGTGVHGPLVNTEGVFGTDDVYAKLTFNDKGKLTMCDLCNKYYRNDIIFTNI